MDKRADTLTDSVNDSEKQKNIKRLKSKRSVYIYIATLFVIVVLFILLSYFMQQRNNSELHTLNEKNATAQLNIENLQTAKLEIQAENDANKTKIAELEKQVSSLEDEIKQVRIDWQNDVQNTKNNDTLQYNELLAQYNELTQKYAAKGNKK